MTASGIPNGYGTVTPYLAVNGASALIDFLKAAFDAEEIMRSEHDGVINNAELRIGTSMLMIGDTNGLRTPFRAMNYMYVPNVDAVYAQAIKAGARTIA